MSDHTDTTAIYEAPAIDERAPIDAPLVGFSSNPV
jgi:hypothetical protein